MGALSLRRQLGRCYAVRYLGDYDILVAKINPDHREGQEIDDTW